MYDILVQFKNSDDVLREIKRFSQQKLEEIIRNSENKLLKNFHLEIEAIDNNFEEMNKLIQRELGVLIRLLSIEMELLEINAIKSEKKLTVGDIHQFFVRYKENLHQFMGKCVDVMDVNIQKIKDNYLREIELREETYKLFHENIKKIFDETIEYLYDEARKKINLYLQYNQIQTLDFNLTHFENKLRQNYETINKEIHDFYETFSTQIKSNEDAISKELETIFKDYLSVFDQDQVLHLEQEYAERMKDDANNLFKEVLRNTLGVLSEILREEQHALVLKENQLAYSQDIFFGFFELLKELFEKELHIAITIDLEKNKNAELKSELDELHKLLPICANCKKIRDENGQWVDVAVYISTHSKTEFSHGICPSCMDILYPDRKKKKEKQ